MSINISKCEMRMNEIRAKGNHLGLVTAAQLTTVSNSSSKDQITADGFIIGLASEVFNTPVSENVIIDRSYMNSWCVSNFSRIMPVINYGKITSSNASIPQQLNINVTSSSTYFNSERVYAVPANHWGNSLNAEQMGNVINFVGWNFINIWNPVSPFSLREFLTYDNIDLVKPILFPIKADEANPFISLDGDVLNIDAAPVAKIVTIRISSLYGWSVTSNRPSSVHIANTTGSGDDILQYTTSAYMVGDYVLTFTSNGQTYVININNSYTI